ncbi:hypothetical protein C4556_00845 [Candidatus Parcubacteria bacterium]|nr:MAG: hypothetical protein C4556_00845 [Candidatus Parcubacteria bacterium]
MVYEDHVSVIRTSRSKAVGDSLRTPYGIDIRRSLSGFLLGGNAEEHVGRRVLLLSFSGSNGANEYEIPNRATLLGHKTTRMRSIERRFAALERERPNHSTYLNFALTILGQNFHPDLIRRWFKKLVDKDDYAQEEKRSILAQLYVHTKPLEAYQNRGQNDQGGGVKT